MTTAVQTIDSDTGKPVVVTQAEATLSVIERAARDPSIDVEKLERLLAMQERILANRAEIAFNAAMREAKLAMPHVMRDSENSHTRSRYAKLETISKAVDPIIHGNGFTLSFGTDASTLAAHYGVTCAVSHIDGHSKLFRADVPSDAAGAKGASNKNMTQAFGSTMTYARRYLKCMIFDIQVTNEDDDGHAAGYRGPARDEFPSDGPRGKSSAQLRRDNVWPQAEKDVREDLLDCFTIPQLNKLKAAYWERARREEWNAHYRDSMRNIFAQAEDDIARQDEGGEE